MSSYPIRTKSGEAYRQLRTKLCDGEFDPGERLTETRVAEILDTSRRTAREAMLRLESEGLLVSRGAYGGKYVRYIEDESRGQVLHHYEVREVIEGLAAKLAADNMTGIQIRELRQLESEMAEAFGRGNAEEYTEASLKFHRYLVANCGNPIILAIWEAYYLMPLSIRSSDLQQRIWSEIADAGSIGRQYGPVVDAIAAHDPEEAERRMKEAVSRTTRAIRKIEWGISEQ